MTTNRPCPLCASTRRYLLYTTLTGQTIHACDSCGFCYADSTPVVDYAAHSIYVCPATYPPKTDHYARIVENCLTAGILRSSSVLDVGCALGGLIEKFREYSFEDVAGISISPEEVAECRRRGLEAAVYSVDDHPADHRQFDLVVLSHVLEHVPNPVPFLQALRHWVKPAGSLYVEVPDALSYDYFTSICQGYNNEHINHFDQNHLWHALYYAGFDIAHTDTYVAEDGHLYPCLYAVAKPRAYDRGLLWAIEHYSSLLNQQLATVSERLAAQLGHDYSGPLAIWGAGQTAHLLLASPLLRYATIVAATDTNPAYHGSRLGDCLVEPPEEFAPPAAVPLLVCSQLSQQAIVARIRALGLTNRLITLTPLTSLTSTTSLTPEPPPL